MLGKSYRVDAVQSSSEQGFPSEFALDVTDVTVHLGVTLYPYAKLQELLQRSYPGAASPIVEVRGQIISDLDQGLALGEEEGGNVVISWDPRIQDRGPHVRRFVRWK
jgi:hypothetical protein